MPFVAARLNSPAWVTKSKPCRMPLGDYERAFTLSENIDRDRIEATLRDGVLHLVLPKAETAKARKIEIKSG
jgi:HSP20 family molecular chaperone IbpA